MFEEGKLELVISHCNITDEMAYQASKDIADYFRREVKYILYDPKKLVRTPEEERLKTWAIQETRANLIRQLYSPEDYVIIVSKTVLNWLPSQLSLNRNVCMLRDDVEASEIMAAVIGNSYLQQKKPKTITELSK